MISIECPHCGLCKQMPADQLPEQEISLKCPKCTNTFAFDPIVAKLVAADEPPPPPPAEAPLPAPQTELDSQQKPSPPPKPCRPQRTEMMRIGELFSRSWQSFTQRIGTLLGISLLGVLLAIGAFFLLQSGTNLLMKISGGGMVASLLGMVLTGGFLFLVITWLTAASIYAIVAKTGIKESLGLGLTRVGAFFWLFLLLGLIIGGGYGLLIVPGVLFTVWFFFAQYILVAEDTRGMEALLQSKEYVRGHGWSVFGRVLLLFLIFLPISFIPLVGPLLAILLGPFSMVYYNEIYQDLRQLKPDLSFPDSSGHKAVWIGLGLLGLLLTPALTYISLGPEARQAVSLVANLSSNNFQLQIDQAQLAQQLETQRQISAPELSEKNKLPVAPKDPLDDLMVYVYALNYKGKITLNGKEFYAIKGDPDMNYNYSTGGALSYGKNVFQVDYSSLPDPWKLELRIKVYKPNWGTGDRTIFKEWVLEDPGGSKTFEIEISPEQVEQT